MTEAGQEKLWLEAEVVGILTVAAQAIQTVLENKRLAPALNEECRKSLTDAFQSLEYVYRTLETIEEFR